MFQFATIIFNWWKLSISWCLQSRNHSFKISIFYAKLLSNNFWANFARKEKFFRLTFDKPVTVIESWHSLSHFAKQKKVAFVKKKYFLPNKDATIIKITREKQAWWLPVIQVGKKAKKKGPNEREAEARNMLLFCIIIHLRGTRWRERESKNDYVWVCEGER